MDFFDWLTKRKKPISQMSRTELRRQELLLEKDRNQLLKKITKIAGDKQTLFERGAKEASPEVRRVLAQEFELKTTEQLMLGRQLNIRSKEMMTVSRLRMLRENADRARGAGSKLGLISEKDMLRLGRLIENDSIRTEAYQERLDEVLSIGAEVDQGSTGLSEAGQAVLSIWEKMDAGTLKDSSEAFEEADRRVREHSAPAEG
ncbi:MAG: hypothetical protein JXB13_20155 [Phycisphaerae bacterium]|nr:hypothetical protein [Phycisphaerae bacterium]